MTGYVVVLVILFLLALGIRYIPNNRIGIVEKRWSRKGSVKSGFIALHGEAGYQPNVLRGGLHYLIPFQYAVRSAPVLNDATAAEALASGVGEVARVVSTGCDMPGVLLAESSDEFLDLVQNADIVISKGQGNYETLSDCPRDVFFLLKAKCPVIARSLGVELNAYVFRHREYGAEKAQSSVHKARI